MHQLASPVYATHLAFAPDGRSLLVAGSRRGRSALWLIPLDDNTRPLGEPVEVLSPPTGVVERFDLAASGDLVVNLVRREVSLWRADLGPDGNPAGDPQQVTRSSARVSVPQFSPDGRRLVYVESAVGRPPTLWLSAPDGSGRELLLADGAPMWCPTWSPDGSRILAGRRQHPSLVWITLRERTVVPAFDVPGIEVHRPSPDGRRIAYHRIESDGRMNVWVQGIDGSPARQVTFDDEAVGYPCWSPDGTRLAVEVKRGARTHLAVVPPDSPGGCVRYPAWSPSGSAVVFERGGSVRESVDRQADAMSAWPIIGA